MDRGTGTKYPLEWTRNQEQRQCALMEGEAKVETDRKREVVANDEEVKLREDK